MEIKDLLLSEQLVWNLAKRGVRFERTAFVMWKAKDSIWRAENPRYPEKNYCAAGDVPSSYVKREGNPRRPVVTNLPTLMSHYVLRYFLNQQDGLPKLSYHDGWYVEYQHQGKIINAIQERLVDAAGRWLINMIDRGAINVNAIKEQLIDQAT